MIIVLEGPDGCGKTTLAREFVKQLNAKYLHMTYRFKDKIDSYHQAALSYAVKKRPVVLDRWWPSEALYAEAYRGGSPWPLMGRWLEALALKHAVVYVMCLPDSVNDAVRNHKRLSTERSEMYRDIRHVTELYQALHYGDLIGDNYAHCFPRSARYIDSVFYSGGMCMQPNTFTYRISYCGKYLSTFVSGVIDFAEKFRQQQFQPILKTKNMVTGHISTARFVTVANNNNHDKAFAAGLNYNALPEHDFIHMVIKDTHEVSLLRDILSQRALTVLPRDISSKYILSTRSVEFDGSLATENPLDHGDLIKEGYY